MKRAAMPGAWRALECHLMAPLMETATVTGELLGTPNAQIRANLTGTSPSCSSRG
jgi:hypothetical protein